MKMITAGIALITVLVLSPVFADDSISPFGKIIWKEEKAPTVSLLYLVITVEKKDSLIDSIKEIVTATLPKALTIAKDYREKHKDVEFNVVYFIKTNRDNDWGYTSGFSIAQLEEMNALDKDKAQEKVIEHAWGMKKLGDIK